MTTYSEFSQASHQDLTAWLVQNIKKIVPGKTPAETETRIIYIKMFTSTLNIQY